MKCIICKKEIPKDRGKNAITCSHNCSNIHIRSLNRNRILRNYKKKINNRCKVCNKLISPDAIHCLKHRKKIKQNIYKYKDNKN